MYVREEGKVRGMVRGWDTFTRAYLYEVPAIQSIARGTASLNALKCANFCTFPIILDRTRTRIVQLCNFLAKLRLEYACLMRVISVGSVGPLITGLASRIIFRRAVASIGILPRPAY